MRPRRAFLKTVVGAGLATAASRRRVLGANERVRLACIGIGLIGKRHLLDFLAEPDAEVAAICEVYPPRLEEGLAAAGARAQGYRDFRRVLDRKDIDVVVVSTPDHWHALMTILACAAGKDVYVEKPLTHAVREGQWMVRAARHYQRVVQVGTQQRSGAHYKRCVELIRAGHIGDLRSARVAAYRNIGIVQWATGEAPRAVSAMGGRASLRGLGETPDVFEALFQYPSFVATWSSREVSAAHGGGLEFWGTKGTLRINRAGLEVGPDPDLSADDQIPQFGEEPRRPRAGSPALRTQPVKDEGYQQIRDQFRPHVRNFLDCVKSRARPAADVESGHRSVTSCHLANIALKLGRVVRWDPEKEDVVADREAQALLTKEYRSPWDRELRAALPS